MHQDKLGHSLYVSLPGIDFTLAAGKLQFQD